MVLVLVLVLAAFALGACSGTSGPSPGTSTGSAARPLATSFTTATASWAVVRVGAFWQLLRLPTTKSRWSLATPPGVADQGGLVAGAMAHGPIWAGFRPVDSLTFSPFGRTENGRRWATGLLPGGLAPAPDALAVGPRARVWAVVVNAGGKLLASTNDGGSWSQLTTRSAMADSSAGKACGLGELTGAAWSGGDSVLIAATCSKPGMVGIFTNAGVHGSGGWALAGPQVGNFGPSSVTVLRLTRVGSAVLAVLRLTSGSDTSSGARYLAAWSTDGGSHWAESAATAPTAGQYEGSGAAGWFAEWVAAPSARSLLPKMSAEIKAFVLIRQGSARLVAEQLYAGPTGAAGRTPPGGLSPLPDPPAGTATVALGPAGEPEALAPQGQFVQIWKLTSTTNGDQAWTRVQSVYVPPAGP